MKEEQKKNSPEGESKKSSENYIKKICVEIIEERTGIMKFCCNLPPKEVHDRKREVLGVLPENKYAEDRWDIALEKKDVTVSFRYDPLKKGDLAAQYLPQPNQEKSGWWDYFAFC